MSSEDNKALVQRLIEEVFNQKQVDRADELVAPDYLRPGHHSFEEMRSRIRQGPPRLP